MQIETQISRKDQIIQTASKLFRLKSYEAASMRDIASELGIEAASLYSHIKSKDEILEIICFRKAEEFLNAIAEVNDIYFDAEESWIQDSIDRLAEEMMRKYNKNKAIILTTLQMYRIDRLDYLKFLLN